MGRRPFPRNMFLKILTLLCVIAVNAVHPQMADSPLRPCEMEMLLRQLTAPDEGNEMHAAALRQQLRDLMETTEQYDYQTPPDPQVELLKRSLSSLARGGVRYGNGGKRNIGALARQGLLRPTDLDVDIQQKRSLATLAKNGQLPATSQEPERDGDDDAETEIASPLMQQWKRNMAAMARAGYLGAGRRAPDSDDEYDVETKRNMASLARSNNALFPSAGAYYAAAVKRNVGTLARDWTLPTSTSNRLNVQKRNIGSMKNSPVHGSQGSKVKRSLRSGIAYDEYPAVNVEQLEPVYQQTTPLDYSELAKYISQLYYVPNQFADDFDSDLHLKKRYLGSMIRDGWSSSYQAPPAKRNIGALARLGLLRSDTNNYGHQMQRMQRVANAEKRHLGSLARAYHSAHTRDNSGPAPAPVNVVQHLSSPTERQRQQASEAAADRSAASAAGPYPAIVLARALAPDSRPVSMDHRRHASHDSTIEAFAAPFIRPAISTESQQTAGQDYPNQNTFHPSFQHPYAFAINPNPASRPFTSSHASSSSTSSSNSPYSSSTSTGFVPYNQFVGDDQTADDEDVNQMNSFTYDTINQLDDIDIGRLSDFIKQVNQPASNDLDAGEQQCLLRLHQLAAIF